jgi:hypothetical protein
MLQKLEDTLWSNFFSSVSTAQEKLSPCCKDLTRIKGAIVDYGTALQNSKTRANLEGEAQSSFSDKVNGTNSYHSV